MNGLIHITFDLGLFILAEHIQAVFLNLLRHDLVLYSGFDSQIHNLVGKFLVGRAGGVAYAIILEVGGDQIAHAAFIHTGTVDSCNDHALAAAGQQQPGT